MGQNAKTGDRHDLRNLIGGGVLVAIGAMTGPAMAADLKPEFDGSKARVYLSASLRSLSETVAATSCLVDTDHPQALAELEDARLQFEIIIAGLRDGSPTLGIPSPETDSRNLRVVDRVGEAWAEVNVAIGHIADGAPEADDMAWIASHHADLYEATETLLSEMSGHYSNPLELLQADAIALNILERQRMLLERINRITCGIHAGHPELGNPDDLAEAIELFDTSLMALRDGYPAAGINPPRTPAVASRLDQAYETWKLAAEKLSAIDATADAATIDAVSAITHDLAADMKNTITLYMIASPGQEDVYRVPLTAYAETELATWTANPDLIAALQAQNAAHADLTQDDINALDQEWRAEAKAGGGVLIDQLLGTPVSGWLEARKDASAGFITEVFVMDDKGLNVAQSTVTSDYWQGDEAKWQMTYGTEGEALHISEIEFDDSTGYYQAQASLTVTDPATGAPIGAITFGINVQRLM